MKLPPDQSPKANGCGHGVPTKPPVLTRADLDGRTRARKQFDAIAAGIASDLGGEGELSVIQRHLVEAFAGCAVHLQAINARLLLGEEIDVAEHAQACSSLVRIATRLGIYRVARDVSGLGELLRQHHNKQASQ